MMKMLVVDDDPAWRALYRMGFEGDFEVFEAVDGLDALAALDRVRPEIIVLDLKMPHLDGMGFLRQMERRGLMVPRRSRRKCGSTHPSPERPRRRSYTKLMNPLSHSY
jgi:CheY-like chemotaxis protein